MDGYKPLEVNVNGKIFLESLEYMGIGMLCIFVVVGIIALCVGLLNIIGRKKKKGESDETEE